MASRISFCPQCGVYLPESIEICSCGFVIPATGAAEADERALGEPAASFLPASAPRVAAVTPLPAPPSAPTPPDPSDENSPPASAPMARKTIAMVVAALLVLVVIVAGVVLHTQKEVPLPANGFARLTVNSSISSAAKLFRDFERQRLRLLALQAQPLGGEPNFATFVQNALAGHSQTPAVPSCPACPPSVDLVSIADQIEQRRMSFGSDLLILLDDNGHVIFRTDQPSVTTPTREDLYESTPMVKRIVDDATIDVATGVLALGNRLFHAAVAPVGVGANRGRVGYLVNALAIDDAFANRIAEITQAGVIFVSPTSLSRSSNAPSVGMQQMSGVEQILRGRTVPPSTVTIDRNSYIMTGEPLVSGDRTVGAAVFLRSLDR